MRELLKKGGRKRHPPSKLLNIMYSAFTNSHYTCYLFNSYTYYLGLYYSFSSYAYLIHIHKIVGTFQTHSKTNSFLNIQKTVRTWLYLALNYLTPKCQSTSHISEKVHHNCCFKFKNQYSLFNFIHPKHQFYTVKTYDWWILSLSYEWWILSLNHALQNLISMNKTDKD